jgi:MFS transporter, PPP family, 3-phenylpropionic acid transporter
MPSQRTTLALMSAFYFFYFGAMGSYLPFVNLYFQDIGLQGRAIGLLAALPPLVLLFGSPLWGAIGDRFNIHRYLLPVATFGSIVPVLIMSRTEHFGALALLVAWAAFFVNPVVPLIDSAVLDRVAGTPTSYGQVRTWGTLGFMTLTLAAGFVLTWLGLRWLFYANALMLFIAGLLALWLPRRRQALRSSFRAGLGSLLRQRPLALFLAGSFLVGATLQAFYAFYPLHLEALGGDASWVGTAGSLAALSELPVVFYSGALLAWLGVRRTVVLGYLLLALRWALLAVLRLPLPVLLTNALHGVTFVPFMVGGITFVERRTPSGLHATAQGMLFATGFGMGAAAGALLGGFIYEAAGGPGLFAVGSVAAVVAAGLVTLAGAAQPEPATS